MAVVVVPVVVAAVEVQVVSVVAVIAVKRRRPVVSVATSVVGFRSVAIARSGLRSGTIFCIKCRQGDMQLAGRCFSPISCHCATLKNGSRTLLHSRQIV